MSANVFVAAALSRNATSPTRELLVRWEQGAYVQLTCEALADELAEKLLAKKFSPVTIAHPMALLERLAEWVEVPPAALEPVREDPDDNVVIACAVIGNAHYLVTYDPTLRRWAVSIAASKLSKPCRSSGQYAAITRCRKTQPKRRFWARP